jgi:MFS family permease
MGALPLVAIVLLDASILQVSLLAAVSGIASAMIALPAGPWMEFRRKRPIMMAADLIRFAALASIPVVAACGALTYPQLCVVAVTGTVSGIVFAAASGAHLKALVPREHHMWANGRFETTFWTATSIGPLAGGVLVSWLGPTTTLTVDAVSFLASAFGIYRLRTPEVPPPARPPGRRRLSEIVEGWRYIFAHRGLRALFWNAMLFGGCVMAAAPLVTVLMLRDLGFTAWQYGLVLGVP